MRQIVHFQAGHCGNHIGTKFWSTISDEHALDSTGKFLGQDSQREGLNVYFSEGMGGRYVPRAVLFDLDRGSLDDVRGSCFGKRFRLESYVSGQASSGSNWCKGHYTDGEEIIDGVLDAARREIQDCDCLQGLQLSHSLGGGTGSGMGTLLISRFREEYSKAVVQTFTVMPSSRVSDIVVEPYNAVLSIHHLIENADSVMMLDNEALYDICLRYLKLSPTYGDLNHLIDGAMSGVTSSYRFPGQLSCDMRKMTMNLVPFPRIHFHTLSIAPLTARGNSWSNGHAAASIAYQMFNARNSLCAADPKNGRYLTASAIFRGRMSRREVEEAMSSIRKSNSSNYIEWIPDNIRTWICDEPAKGQIRSGTLISNTTSVQDVFKRISEQFTAIYKRKAFLHWFTGEGMDKLEFTEAESNMLDLISEYQSGQSIPDESDEGQEIWSQDIFS